MENISLKFCCCRVQQGGMFIGIVTLIENIVKGFLCVIVVACHGFLGNKYEKVFDKGKKLSNFSRFA
jgi:hypothetical protein